MGKEGAGKRKVAETHLEVDGKPAESSPKLEASNACTSDGKGKTTTKATPKHGTSNVLISHGLGKRETKATPKHGASDVLTSHGLGKTTTKATPPLPESKDRRSPHCMANLKFDALMFNC